MSDAPLIEESSLEERRAFIKEKYPCIADCDMCGLCKVFHGKDPEQAYVDYIVGNRSFMEVSLPSPYRHPQVFTAFAGSVRPKNSPMRWTTLPVL